MTIDQIDKLQRAVELIVDSTGHTTMDVIKCLRGIVLSEEEAGVLLFSMEE